MTARAAGLYLDRDVTEKAEGCPMERQEFHSFLARLSCVTGTFDVVPVKRTATCGRQRRMRPGFMVHSLFGMGLRSAACRQEPPCEKSCGKPAECAWGLLMEPCPPKASVPLSRVARVPAPVVIEAPWDLWHPGHPLRFRMHLLGNAARWNGMVEEALLEGFSAGVGEPRRPAAFVCSGWIERRPASAGQAAERNGDSARVRLEFQTPIRLVRNGRELAEFDLASLVRDLTFRLAVWGHLYEGLAWPPVWWFLWEDAARTRMARSNIRTVSFHRYSGRQDRVIPMKGLLGAVELQSVSADLLALFRFGEVCGVGKGASIGLGRITLGKRITL